MAKTSLLFALFTCYCLHLCLHVSLKQNINLIHEISHTKYNTFRKFSAQHTFVRKHNNKKFSHKLFGIEINAKENKANYMYGTSPMLTTYGCSEFQPDIPGQDL